MQRRSVWAEVVVDEVATLLLAGIHRDFEAKHRLLGPVPVRRPRSQPARLLHRLDSGRFTRYYT
jgi:hypothetical protein